MLKGDDEFLASSISTRRQPAEFTLAQFASCLTHKLFPSSPYNFTPCALEALHHCHSRFIALLASETFVENDGEDKQRQNVTINEETVNRCMVRLGFQQKVDEYKRSVSQMKISNPAPKRP